LLQYALRSFRMMLAVAAAAAAVASAKSQRDLTGHARQLSSVSDLSVNLDNYAGLTIARANAMIMFSDDQALVRTDDGLIVASPSLQLTGDLAVTGTITNDGLSDVSDSVDTLVSGLAAAVDSISSIEAAASALDARVDDLETQASSLSSTLESAEADIVSLQQAGTAVASDVSGLDEAISTLSAAVTVLTVTAACPVGNAVLSPVPVNELTINNKFWTDLGTTVEVETLFDTDMVLVMCNMNYNPQGDSFWGEFTIFRNDQYNLGGNLALQRLDADNEYNQPSDLVFLDSPGTTGKIR
jgi:hypothetical protein